MFCSTNQHVEQRYLGTESESMVYAGELEAIQMALDHVKLENNSHYKKCRIFIYRQSTRDQVTSQTKTSIGTISHQAYPRSDRHIVRSQPML
jgi:hypothetical protein